MVWNLNVTALPFASVPCICSPLCTDFLACLVPRTQLGRHTYRPVSLVYGILCLYKEGLQAGCCFSRHACLFHLWLWLLNFFLSATETRSCAGHLLPLSRSNRAPKAVHCFEGKRLLDCQSQKKECNASWLIWWVQMWVQEDGTSTTSRISSIATGRMPEPLSHPTCNIQPWEFLQKLNLGKLNFCTICI